MKELLYGDNLSKDIVFAVCWGGGLNHAGKKVWFWCTSRSKCTTYYCYSLHSAQTRTYIKTLLSKLAEVLKFFVKTMHLRNSALRHCILRELCKGIECEFEVLLCHSIVR